MKRRTTIVIGIVAILAIGVSALAAIPKKTKNKDSSPKTAVSNTPAPVNVSIKKVDSETVVQKITVNGVTTATTDITLSAETAGKLEYTGASIGDAVRKGQVLARVNYTTQRAMRTQAKASYNLAKTTYERLATLGSDLVSAQKLDEAMYAMQGAEANLALVTANASNAIVRARQRGIVAQKYAEEGEFVAPGTPLYRVIDMRTIIVEASIPETQVVSVEKGSSVEVNIGALDQMVSGQVKSVIPSANPDSKTFTIRVEIPNQDGRILVGMSAGLQIGVATLDNVVVIPQDLILEGNGRRTVFVVDNNLAEEREVTTGAIQGDRVVIPKGLEPGDMIVTLGQRDLSDQQPVDIIK